MYEISDEQAHQAHLLNVSELSVLRNNPDEYKTEWSSAKRANITGYAGNQPSGGTKFPTGGGFYYSSSGGPTASVTVSFPSPFSAVSIRGNLGSTASSGIYVNAPTTTRYYKLYAEKEYEVKAYVIYKKQYNDYGGYTWVRWSGGQSLVHVRTVASAKVV